MARALLSVVMAATLVFGAVPATAFAVDGNQSPAASEEVLTASSSGQPTISDVFTDVPEDQWYAFDGWVSYVKGFGLMNGLQDDKGNETGLFDPEGNVLRAQVAVVLWRMAGSPTGGKEDFTDVAKGDYFYDAVVWAVNEGITTGRDDADGNPTGLFDPLASVTREELSAFIMRYAASTGFDTSSQADLGIFPDESDISDWARTFFSWCVYEGIITGVDLDSGPDYAKPQNTATRAQLAKIITVLHRDVLDARPGTTVDYAEGVIDASAAAQATKAEFNDNSVELTVQNVPSAVGVGDIVMIGSSEALPFGAAVKVASISRSGNTATITGTRPEYTEIYDDIVIDEEISIAGAQPASTEADQDIAVLGLDPYRFDYTLDLGDGNSVTFTGAVRNIQGHAYAIPPLTLGAPSYADIDFSADIYVSASGTVQSLPSDMRKIQVLSVPVPFASVPGAGVYVNVYLTFSVTGKVTASLTCAVTADVDKSWWKPMTATGNARVVDSNFEVAAQGRSGLKAETALQVAGWPLISPSIEAGLAAEASVKSHITKPFVCTDVTGWVYLTVMATLVEDISDGEWGIKEDLWTKKDSPFKLPLLHFEDGSRVPQCTWKDTFDIFSSIPSSYNHTSGVGGWATELTVKPEGRIAGSFQDIDMGSRTIYHCKFTGFFSKPQKISDTHYVMTVEKLSFAEEPGTVTYKDGVRYEASRPAGISEGQEFHLYLKGESMSNLPEDVIWAGSTIGQWTQSDQTLNKTIFVGKDSDSFYSLFYSLPNS